MPPTPPTQSAPAQAGAPTEQGGDGEGYQQVKHSDFKRIKQEQRDRGRGDALAELEVRARAAGFASLDEALKARDANKPRPTQTARTTPQEPPKMPKPKIPDPKQAAPADPHQRESDRARAERMKVRKQWKQSEAKRRELQSQLDAKDAEMALRSECYQHGVKDVDYAIRLLTRQLEGKSVEEIGKFDRPGFFTGLRSEKPYLFGESVAPATTGVDPSVKPAGALAGGAPATPGAAPATPAPGAATVADVAAKKFDARKAKPEEVQARLRELGLNPHL